MSVISIVSEKMIMAPAKLLLTQDEAFMIILYWKDSNVLIYIQ